VLFNARFYYPVLGVLFLDLGLTVAQYAALNAVWAAAILLLEIPSGAMADAIGRKRMVVLAAGLYVAEMLVFALTPAGLGIWTFAFLAVNRVLSGAAEACASGADEALAYDSLPAEGREAAWAAVLNRLLKWQSAAFFVAMLVGAAIFDRGFLAGVFGEIPFSTTKWPVYATLGLAVACVGVALALRDTTVHNRAAGPREALANIARGARAVVTDRRIFAVLLALIACDSFARLLVTFASNYNRLLGIPEVLFGPIGAAMALLGFVAGPVARRLVASSSAPKNFLLIGLLVVTGLTGAALALPGVGVVFLIPLGLALSLGGFFASHYLNAWTASDLRATVLSFRGVALNATYGAAGLAFSALATSLHRQHPGAGEEAVFARALVWLPPAFLVLAAAVAAVVRLRAR
jgi:MFS family permease